MIEKRKELIEQIELSKQFCADILLNIGDKTMFVISDPVINKDHSFSFIVSDGDTKYKHTIKTEEI